MSNPSFVVFNTTRKHGQMNSAPRFYPDLEEKPAERKRLMNEHKQIIADEVGFKREKIFMAMQANQANPYEPGTSYTITKEDVEKYPDLYDYDVYADTVKITMETPEIVIGFNVSDAPNVIAMNEKTMEATSTFCSGKHINQGVPMMISDTLGGNPENIVVSVSPFAHNLLWIGQKDLAQPTWTNNEEFWNGCLKRLSNRIVIIDIQRALGAQLTKSGILAHNIYWGEDSFGKDEVYYSSQRANLYGDISEDGRFMHGVFLTEKPKEPKEPYIKVYGTR